MTSDLGPLLVDPRVGSKELIPVLLRLNLAFTVQPLEFGDVVFIGYGPHGLTPIGIERKTVRDLVQSLMSARLQGHQLPGIVKAYDFKWIIIEGSWRTNDVTGFVETPRSGEWQVVEPRIDGASLIGWLTTLELFGGVRIWRTYNLLETVQFLGALQQWWTGKEYEEHRAHLALYHPDRTLFVKPSLVRRWAAELPGIGFDRSRDVAAAFPTPFDLACAGEKEWRAIPGIGKILTTRILQAIHARE